MFRIILSPINILIYFVFMLSLYLYYFDAPLANFPLNSYAFCSDTLSGQGYRLSALGLATTIAFLLGQISRR